MSQKERWIGAIVRLKRDIETRGGVIFRAGVKMKVMDSNAGGLWLRTYKRGWWHSVNGIRKFDVVVLQWGRPNDEPTGDQSHHVENTDCCPFAP